MSVHNILDANGHILPSLLPTVYAGIAQTSTDTAEVTFGGTGFNANSIVLLTFLNDNNVNCQNPVGTESCWYNFESADPTKFQIHVTTAPASGKYFKIAWWVLKI